MKTSSRHATRPCRHLKLVTDTNIDEIILHRQQQLSEHEMAEMEIEIVRRNLEIALIELRIRARRSELQKKKQCTEKTKVDPA